MQILSQKAEGAKAARKVHLLAIYTLDNLERLLTLSHAFEATMLYTTVSGSEEAKTFSMEIFNAFSLRPISLPMVAPCQRLRAEVLASQILDLIR